MPRKNPVQSVFGTAYRLRDKEKDPVIDAVHTVVDRAGLEIKKISEKGGAAPSTMKGWFDGDTRHPQHKTLASTLRVLGYEFQIVPSRVSVNGKGAKATAPTIVFREARSGRPAPSRDRHANVGQHRSNSAV